MSANELPARPRVTLAYRASAYNQADLDSFASSLCPVADVECEPLYLALMGGSAELQLAVVYGEPVFASGTVSRPVHDSLLDVCRKLAAWFADLEGVKDTSPELVGVSVCGRDVRVDLACDLSPETCLGRDELRAIPGVLRDIAGVLCSVLEERAASVVAIGVHANPQCAGGSRCVFGRFWELGSDADEPALVIDSWRERVYIRSNR